MSAAASSGSGFVPSTTVEQADSPELWASLRRPLPDRYADARLGIFVHWGPYSVPAWGTTSPDGPALLRLPVR